MRALGTDFGTMLCNDILYKKHKKQLYTYVKQAYA